MNVHVRNSCLHAVNVVALGFAVTSSATLYAQTWPSAPVRVVVNFPPGGVADALARAIAPPLTQSLRQVVVVENKGGAAGNIGAEAVARAPNDGHTLLMSPGSPISINPLIYAKMAFDPERDLMPVAAVARALVYLMALPSMPANNLPQFVSLLKSNPGRFSYGSPGPGSSPHLAGELFKQRLGIDAAHIPYRGAGPALTAFLGGEVQFMFDPGPGLRYVREGKLKLLGVGSLKRAPQAPDTPTLAESGLPGFDADTLFGLYARAGTAPHIVSQLHGEIAKALRNARVLEVIDAFGAQPAPISREEFARLMKQERENFAPLIKSIGLRVE